MYVDRPWDVVIVVVVVVVECYCFLIHIIVEQLETRLFLLDAKML